jgi:hypothetical protein
MPPTRPTTTSSRLTLGALGLAVTLVALLPWWRNHGFLRDFYDYGLFINVNARLAEGQRPFTDFTTPAQSAAFLLNYAAETAGGGTYLGLTRGAAVLIVLSALALTLMLARRFHPWVAALLALAIVVGSASQHTIIFYNPLGVVAMALTVWGFAVAPLLRRETLGWHLLAAAGLFLGGVNKINFHLLACVMAVGWVLHAWVAQKPAAGRALLTLAFIAAFGLVLPVGLEIAWTGAGWSGWYYNVVELPLGARGGRISSLFSPALYLTTLHNYYGQLRVPQIGLIGVLMPLIAVVAAWRGTAAADRKWRAAFLILAGLLAAFASSALLLTNNEIAYVTFAAALVITIGLWLGFGPAPRGGWFAAGVLLPALILAAAGGESAWRGERSQFGHDIEPRSAYWRGERCGDEFRYLHGLSIPPGLGHSLAGLAAWRRDLPGDEATRVYFGPGSEWLGRVWPTRYVKGLPLVAAAFDSQREADLLKREVISGTAFHHLLVVEAWDYWNEDVRNLLRDTAVKERLNSVFMVYRKLPPGTVSARPLLFMYGGFGGNVDGMRVISGLPMQTLPDGLLFLGLGQGEGKVEVNTPCNRMSAEYVLRRTAPGSPGALTVDLAIHARMPDGLLPRWHAAITLPDGVDELVVPTDQIDGSGLPLTFSVTVPPESSGKVLAGWRSFRLLDTPDREDEPPILRPSAADLLGASESVRAALLPASLQDAPVYQRSGWLQDDRLLLPYGSEVWIRARGLYTDIQISAQLQDVRNNKIPNLQVVYYKGGRLEPFMPVPDAATGTLRFTGWTPEHGGWIGILADHQPGSPSMLVKIHAATRH